jgi:AcrR family transcriptional regulator
MLMTTCILSGVASPPEDQSTAEPTAVAAGRGHNRRRDAEASRAAILEAARQVFAERGYARATIREIARRAGVTHGLVMRHFGSKEQLLVTALPGTRHIPNIIAGDRATLPHRIAASFVEQTESSGDHALIALIRSAAAGDEAPMRLYHALERSAAEAYHNVFTGPDADVYVDLLAALLIGVTFSRHVARTGKLAEMSTAELIAYLTTTINALLEPVLPSA